MWCYNENDMQKDDCPRLLKSQLGILRIDFSVVSASLHMKQVKEKNSRE
jgi:hypothetical protein